MTLGSFVVRVDRAGGMAVRAVQQLQIGAVRVDAVQIELVVVDVCSQRVYTMRPFGSTAGSRSWLWLNEIWWMFVPSASITCSTNAGSLSSSSWAAYCGLFSSSRIARDWRWRVELNTILPSGR